MPPPPPPRRPDPKAAKAQGAGPKSGQDASTEENMYIPDFIRSRPFYAGEGEGDSTTDYLAHQRLQKKKDDTKLYDRGKTAGPAATRFRKGACENCGAMTHTTKACLSRPRVKGARWTGKNIQADEVVQDVQVGWDAKRDRWNGFEAKDYRAVVEQYNEMDTLRREAQAKEAAAAGREEGDVEDGYRYVEESDMGRNQPTSTRQLRIREDTAKYLLNLDVNSAKYDPKTRTMVIVDGGGGGNGSGSTTAGKDAEYLAEESFVRGSGDAAEFDKAQRYAWETEETTGDTRLHVQPNPTAGELQRRKKREEDENKQRAHEEMLRQKYGVGPDDGDDDKPIAALRDMAVTESERFVEYDELGLIKGAPTAVGRSIYAEDVLTNSHTSVWGSWWSNFRWGYACCHSLSKNSYCTGEEGKQAWEAAERQRTGAGLLEDGDVAADADADAEPKAGGKKADPEPSSAAPTKKRTVEEMMGGVSEAEMDEYRRKRTAAEDPMANYLGRDQLVL